MPAVGTAATAPLPTQGNRPRPKDTLRRHRQLALGETARRALGLAGVAE